MIERLYIQDIQKELQYRDRRSVRRWCCNNGIRLLSDFGSNKQFVLRDEFEKAKNKSYYISAVAINSSLNVFSQNCNNKADKLKQYIPKGENEKKFLSIFTSL
jgi:hypothetical protein